MKRETFAGKLVRLSVPIALQSLMLALVAAADAWMLGSLDQNSMAAVSLATQVQFIQNMVLTAATSAGAILGAQYWGKGDSRALKDIFSMMLRFCGGVSLIFFLACELFPHWLMSALTSVPELKEIGIGYLRVAGWSYLLTGISQCYLTVMKVSDHAAPSAYISCGAVALNIICNALLIYGWLGLPALGVRGAATATLIARIVELTLAVAFSLCKGFIHPEWSGLMRRNRLLAQDFRKCALPLLGGALFWGVGFVSYTAIMGHLEADAAAANSIASVVRDLICCLCNGIGAAAGIMVGNELGAGRLELGREYGERLMRLSYITGVFSALVVLCSAPLVMGYIRLTDRARALLWGMLIIQAVYMIGRSVNTVVINGIFAAGGDTLFDMYSLAVCMWGLAIPLSLLGAFVFHWPVLAVYACTCLYEVGKIPWVMLHYRKYKWVKDLTREQPAA